MNLMFSTPIRKNYLIILCAISVTFISFSAVSWYRVRPFLANTECRTTLHYYETHPDATFTLASGEYRSHSKSGLYGKLSYGGRIINYGSQGEILDMVPVYRELDFRMEVKFHRIVSEITATNRRLGDRSTDEQVRNYIFPTYSVGGINNTGLFILNDKSLATGPEHLPRLICK